MVQQPKKIVRTRKSAKVARPARKGRSLTVDLTRLTSGRILFGVSERFEHPEVRMHKEREKRSDGVQLLKALERVL